MGLFDKEDETEQNKASNKGQPSSDQDDALALGMITGTTIGTWSGSGDYGDDDGDEAESSSGAAEPAEG